MTMIPTKLTEVLADVAGHGVKMLLHRPHLPRQRHLRLQPGRQKSFLKIHFSHLFDNVQVLVLL